MSKSLKENPTVPNPNWSDTTRQGMETAAQRTARMREEKAARDAQAAQSNNTIPPAVPSEQQVPLTQKIEGGFNKIKQTAEPYIDRAKQFASPYISKFTDYLSKNPNLKTALIGGGGALGAYALYRIAKKLFGGNNNER